MMPKQEKPYTKLIESAKQQPEFHYDQIEGTIVGFMHQHFFMA